MKIYSKTKVFDASLDRIRNLCDDFDEVIVGYSGGKDSTVCLELSLMIAKEKNRLPLKVLFIDQESEWESTIDIVTEVMSRPEVQPLWFQMPISMTNNTSAYERFSECWNPESTEFVHPFNPISIKENVYGTKRFGELFAAILKKDYPNKKTCYIAGVRTEENPKRYIALTHRATYKYITWAKKLSNTFEHFTFYPIYDWGYTDVWKAIHDNKWKYNKVYDELYRKGYKIPDMRVSNLHHETALSTLLKVQEIEPKTWERMQQKIEGINTIKHLKSESFMVPKTLPYMFKDWEDYAMHLAKHLIQKDEHKKIINEVIENQLKAFYSQEPIRTEFFRAIIRTILSADWDLTKYTNWTMRQDVYGYRTFLGGRRDKKQFMDLRFFNAEQIDILMNDLGIDKTQFEV